MNEYTCPFCGIECATIQAVEGHKPLCLKNPANQPESLAPVTVKGPETYKSTPDLEKANLGPVTSAKEHIVRKGH